jgi:hypothetical protein
MASIDQLEARLAELEARAGIGVEPLAANPPITIGELVDVPAPGSPIASAWSQEVSARIVHRFATTAARDAAYPAAAAAAGAMCETAGGTLWLSSGSVWLPVGGAGLRIGGQWSRNAVQAASSGSMTAVLFDTDVEDPDNLLVPPSNSFAPKVAGVYAATATTSWSTSGLGVDKGMQIVASGAGRTFQQAGFQTTGVLSCSAIVPLTVGQTLTVFAYHTNGAIQNMTGYLSVYRVAP